MVPANLNTLNFPITTDLQFKFWGSRHKCNKMKSIIAFSLNLSNANDNLRRYGYTLSWRKKALKAFAKYINTPSMVGITFSEVSDPWWICMPYTPDDSVIDRLLKIWEDEELWGDDLPWMEFLETLPEPLLKEWLDEDPWGDALEWEEWINNK